jgi:hypothetical protein
MRRQVCKPDRGVFAASTGICRGILNFVFGILFPGCLAGVVALAGENPGAAEFHKTACPLILMLILIGICFLRARLYWALRG